MINLHKSKDNKFYFTVTAKNGKVLVTSETYNTRRAMNKGVDALVKIIGSPCWKIRDLSK